MKWGKAYPKETKKRKYSQGEDSEEVPAVVEQGPKAGG